MAVSLSLTDILKLVRESKATGREKVVGYLEAVKAEAEGAVSLWQANLANAEKELPNLNGRQSIQEVKAAFQFNSNVSYAAALRSHYSNASASIKGRLPEDLQERFIHHLAEFLLARDSINKAYSEFWHQTQCALGVVQPELDFSPKWFLTNKAEAALLRCEEDLDVMRAELGELKAMIAQYRSS